MRFKLTIVSPREKWEQDVDSVTIPSIDGELTILYNHAPIMGRLGEGQIVSSSYKKKVKDGFFEFLDNHARIFIKEHREK